ncbi:4-amino-4-deoxychorismate lyase [Tamaricihabitans halophyticus]|uniref:4-amino-4-deoxychorismate lyase n=1 Tax=Tamaricihabitans halophyticus TaxID=1262583 RepID=A0A4R2QZ33_9PSEU|nr:aminodeoxychorismate lyase [Tamaricihabitans halophyticus]TCP54348.1 4-amino-4-deoxychorismate lyase [Tamaricihabitans halophyticus]
MRVLVFLDGTVGDPEAAHIRVDDLGLLRGDGIFETVLVVDGKPRELDRHLDRLASSAAKLDLPVPDREAWRQAVHTALVNWPAERECAVKLVYTRGPEGSGEPTAFVLAQEIADKVLRQRAAGVAVVTLERGFGPEVAERAPWLLLGAKSLSYAVNMAALREAERRDADDVIFLAADGSVLEGPTSTVVIAQGETLRTPPARTGILPGTTQAGLFDGAESSGWSVKVEPLTMDDLRAADVVLLVSSVRKVTRVVSIDGEALPDASGLHRQLLSIYESLY